MKIFHAIMFWIFLGLFIWKIPILCEEFYPCPTIVEVIVPKKVEVIKTEYIDRVIEKEVLAICYKQEIGGISLSGIAKDDPIYERLRREPIPPAYKNQEMIGIAITGVGYTVLSANDTLGRLYLGIYKKGE